MRVKAISVAALLLLLLAMADGYVKTTTSSLGHKKSSRKYMIPVLSKIATTGTHSGTYFHSHAVSHFLSAVPLVQSIVAVASVIAFHEAGHFLAAKSQNIKISSYNIGYGPKLFSVNDLFA